MYHLEPVQVGRLAVFLLGHTGSLIHIACHDDGLDFGGHVLLPILINKLVVISRGCFFRGASWEGPLRISRDK